MAATMPGLRVVIAEDAVQLFDEYVREPLRTQDLTDDERAELDRLLPVWLGTGVT